MKKLISILLSTLLILPVIASFGITSAAETTFEDLWQKKVDYEKEWGYLSTGAEYIMYVCYGDDHGEGGDNYGYGWAFLLFTEQGRKLTYQLELYLPQVSFLGYEIATIIGEDRVGELTCLELKEMIYASYDQSSEAMETTKYAHKSPYRNVVKTLGLTPEELKEAYRKMKEEPESARDVLSFMTDAEFASFADYLRDKDVPPDFVIEAACLADDVQAETLLAVPGNVYIPEMDLTASCLAFIKYYQIDIYDIVKCDLTTDSFVRLVADIERSIERFDKDAQYYSGMIDEYGNWPSDRFEILVKAQKAQLAAKETGDGAVQGITVLALAIPALAATLILRRKRKI